MVESGTLSEAEFSEWSKSFVLFCHVTSRVDGEKHGDLLATVGGRGFPFFVALDASGRLIQPLEAARTVAGFESLMKDASARVAQLEELEKKAAAGDAAAGKELLFARLELKRLTVAEAEKASAGMELTEEERTSLHGLLANLQVEALLDGLERDDKDAQLAAGKSFLALARAGRVPTDDGLFQPFWILIMDHAEAGSDGDAYEMALNHMEERFGDNPRARSFLEKRRETLAGLRKKAGEDSSDDHEESED